MATKRQERCAICLDSFKDPRLIPCHHSFCCLCLEDYVSNNLRNGKFKCPICKRSAKLPKKGVAAFQVNFYIDSNESARSTSDGNSSGVTCDVCGSEKEARCTCMECTQNLCQCCCENHEKVTTTKHHRLYNIGSKELEINGQAYKRALCRKHTGEEIQLVCTQCGPNIPMCLKCKAYDHDTHRSKSIAEAAAEIKRNLTDLLSNSSTFQSKNSVKELEDKEKKEIESIDQQHSKLQSALDQLVTNMKAKVKSVYGKQKKANTDLTLAKNDAEKLIEQGTCIDIIEKGQVLLHSLSKTMLEMKPLLVGTENTLFAPAVIIPQKLTAFMGILQTDLSHERYIRRFFSSMPSGYGRHNDLAVMQGPRRSCPESFETRPVNKFLTPLSGHEIFAKSADMSHKSFSFGSEDYETLRNASERFKQKRLLKYAVTAEGITIRGERVVPYVTVPVQNPLDVFSDHGSDSSSNSSIPTEETEAKEVSETSNPNDETKAKEVSGPSDPTEETKAKEVSDPSNPNEETNVKEVSDVCIPERSGPEGSSGASSVSTEASINSETTDQETRPKEI